MSYAITGGYMKVVSLLVDKIETDADMNGKIGDTTLSYATRKPYDTIEEELVTKANCQHIFLMAAALGHDKSVKLLLERNEVDVNVRDNIGETALSSAATNGRESIVRLLLEQNEIDVNARDILGQSPLFRAVRSQIISVVELLLATDGIEVNMPTEDGDTPFSFAAERGDQEVGRLLLLSNRADPKIVEELEYPEFTSTIRMHS